MLKTRGQYAAPLETPMGALDLEHRFPLFEVKIRLNAVGSLSWGKM
jgi:hypothetical protein